MMLTIYVPKADHTFECEVEALPPVSLQYILEYGARQAVVDTTAGVKRVEWASDAAFHAAALVKAEKRWAQIMSGNVPGSRAPVDSTTAKARELAKLMANDSGLAAEVEALIAARKAA